jgi:hypothetical protein
MAFPNKPLTVDLDAIGLDDWIAFAEAGAQLQALQGNRNLTAMADALRSARAMLIAFLASSEWTAEDVGKLNLGEMQQLFAQLQGGMRGPNGMSGSPSTPPTSMGERSRSKHGSATPRKNGAVPRGKLRPSSA